MSIDDHRDGYRCGNCGAWTPYGMGHACQMRWGPYYAPNGNPLPPQGAQPLSFMTEERVRQIVREEIAKAKEQP